MLLYIYFKKLTKTIDQCEESKVADFSYFTYMDDRLI